MKNIPNFEEFLNECLNPGQNPLDLPANELVFKNTINEGRETNNGLTEESYKADMYAKDLSKFSKATDKLITQILTLANELAESNIKLSEPTVSVWVSGGYNEPSTPIMRLEWLSVDKRKNFRFDNEFKTILRGTGWTNDFRSNGYVTGGQEGLVYSMVFNHDFEIKQ